jgi:aspartate/methionine/tyrosine aminotransferase
MTAPPSRGLAALREALAYELGRARDRSLDPETEILVTNGAMQALGVCMRSLLRAGDEVIVPAPCFFFEGPIRAAGATPVYVHASPADGWRWDADAIARIVGPRTRALLLCNPGNPTGYLPAQADVAAVVGVAERHGLLVVTDEAYEAAVWSDTAFASAFGMAEDAIVIRSLGKSLSLPQLRLGLVAGPAALVERCVDTLEWDCLRVGVAAQEAALAVLSGPREWLDSVHAGLVADRAAAIAAIAATPGLSAVPPDAAPFLFVHADRGRELATELARVGLPVVDGIHFQAPGYARLPFAGAAEAADALAAALARWAAPTTT